MKEQWRKHDSDAKLLQNVEEGRPQPIKIELPISAFGLKQDDCCSRLIKLLRIAILFVLLLILSWTAVTLYSNYYPRQLVTDENAEQLVINQHDYSSDENKLSFKNKVYALSNEQDNVASNKIDESTSSVPLTLSEDDDNYRVRAFLKSFQMKYIPIEITDIVVSQETEGKNEFQNIDNDFLQSKIPRHEDFKEMFDLDVSGYKSVNEDDVVPVQQQVYVKLVDVPEKELNPRIDDEVKVDKSEVQENESNEVIVIPSLEDEDTQQTTDQDFENDMEITEVDDLEELISGIANVMGLLEEPSGETDQSTEESIAVIQEEIKKTEEMLEVVDLDRISSTEEKSSEEYVSVIQEEIKDDDDGVPIIYSVELEETSEEEDNFLFNEESVPVIQEEIKTDSEEYSGKKLNIESVQMRDEKEYDIEDPSSTEKSEEKTSSDTSLDDLDENSRQNISPINKSADDGYQFDILMRQARLNELDKELDIEDPSSTEKSEEKTSSDTSLDDLDKSSIQNISPINESTDDEYQFGILMHQAIIKAMQEVGKEYDYSEEKVLETTEKIEETIEQVHDADYVSNERSSRYFQINEKFLKFLTKKLEPIVGPYFELIGLYYGEYFKNQELEETQDNLSAYTAKLLFDVDIRTFVETLNIVSRLIMDDSNSLEYEKIVADDDDVILETFSQNHIYNTLNLKTMYFGEWKMNTNKNSALYNIALFSAPIYNKMFRVYLDFADKSPQSTQMSMHEFISLYQSRIEKLKDVEEYEQTEESAEKTTVSSFKSHGASEESEEESATSTLQNNEDSDGNGLKEEFALNSDRPESSDTNVNPTEYDASSNESDEDFAEFMKLLQQYVANSEENEEDLPVDDPYDY